MSYYAIKGIQDGLGDKKNPLRQAPLRMELEDWCSSTDVVHKNQRALFFQAFHNFCQMEPTGKFSYFQIAGGFLIAPILLANLMLTFLPGIHGQTFVPWTKTGAPRWKMSRVDIVPTTTSSSPPDIGRICFYLS